MKVFTIHSDAGHSWVAVKRKLLRELGLTEEISSYSYVKGNTVYLEEDCDAPTFLKAYEANVGTYEIKYGKHYQYSPIRSYKSYQRVVI